MFSNIVRSPLKVFEWLSQNQPSALKKLIAINGDVSLPDLGISVSDIQELGDNVSVVFHSAARVKFDDDLRSAIDSNVKGPGRVANFCQQLKNLKVVCFHVHDVIFLTFKYEYSLSARLSCMSPPLTIIWTRKR